MLPFKIAAVQILAVARRQHSDGPQLSHYVPTEQHCQHVGFLHFSPVASAVKHSWGLL